MFSKRLLKLGQMASEKSGYYNALGGFFIAATAIKAH
jgi:hypothetical protein